MKPVSVQWEVEAIRSSRRSPPVPRVKCEGLMVGVVHDAHFNGPAAVIRLGDRFTTADLFTVRIIPGGING